MYYWRDGDRNCEQDDTMNEGAGDVSLWSAFAGLLGTAGAMFGFLWREISKLGAKTDGRLEKLRDESVEDRLVLARDYATKADLTAQTRHIDTRFAEQKDYIRALIENRPPVRRSSLRDRDME